MRMLSSTTVDVPSPASDVAPGDRSPSSDRARGSASSNTSYREKLPPAILWIDDALEPTDPAVRLLKLEGFAVDCATSGAAGLGKVHERSYDAVILDLRLPDISGLSVLAELRATGVSAPVLMLTGYGDTESATAALRLGVQDFRWKPLIGNELIAVVRSLVNAATELPEVPRAGEHGATIVRPALRMEALSALLNMVAEGAGLDQLLRLLIRTLGDADLDVPSFVACAEALRIVLAAPETAPSEIAVRLREVLTRPTAPSSVEHAKVRQAIATLEAAIRNHVRVTESDLARELGIDPAHLGRLVRAQTGVDFRQWRSALGMRIAIRALADDDVQVAQVAFSVGYEHPSQFDREFRRLFGISPRAFRRLLKSLR